MSAWRTNRPSNAPHDADGLGHTLRCQCQQVLPRGHAYFGFVAVNQQSCILVRRRHPYHRLSGLCKQDQGAGKGNWLQTSFFDQVSVQQVYLEAITNFRQLHTWILRLKFSSKFRVVELQSVSHSSPLSIHFHARNRILTVIKQQEHD